MNEVTTALTETPSSVFDPLHIAMDQWVMFLISVTVIGLLAYFGKVLIKEREQKKSVVYDMSSPSIITEFIKNRVWIASKDKLDFIRNTLLINHIEWREDEVWLKVSNYLENKTEVYKDEFSTLRTPYWDLWGRYNECFSIKECCWDVKSKFFSILSEEYSWLSQDKRALIIYLIVEDISNIMMRYQIKAATKLLSNLKTRDYSRI